MTSNFVRRAVLALGLSPLASFAAEPVALSASTYDPRLSVVLVEINWGRVWKCGQFQNAQLEALEFTPIAAGEELPTSLDLETPSRLAVDNRYLPYALVVQPGEYALTGFDVKVARSARDVAHLRGTKENLVKDGKPVGGTFTVAAGEAVYIGHFGLDCGAEPFLWRQFLADRGDFVRYAGEFREKYPFLKVPVIYRLFATKIFGGPQSLADPVVD